MKLKVNRCNPDCTYNCTVEGVEGKCFRDFMLWLLTHKECDELVHGRLTVVTFQGVFEYAFCVADFREGRLSGPIPTEMLDDVVMASYGSIAYSRLDLRVNITTKAQYELYHGTK